MQSFIPDDIPVLEFVSPIPLLRPDGTFAIESGYHCDLRAYLDFNLDLSSVKIHPNLQDVEEAKSLILNEILVDFPFETLSDRANAFGLLFLPFCRPFIDDLTPLHLVSAASPGTGKNLLLDLYSTITADQKLNPRPISNNEEEMRKLITSELLSSPPMILLDNLNDFQSSGVFHSLALASVLTARVWTDRYLGQSKMVSSVNNTIWLMTGNNPSLTSELQRRTSKIKMVSSLQKPWDRTGFRHPNLLLWVKEHRSQIISALMTLINAWVSSGMPFSSKRMGSFERYSSVIGGILESIGIDEFLDNGKMTVDNETATMEVLTGIWYKTFGTRAISASELFGICLAGDFHLDLGIKYFGNSGTQHLAELGVIMKRLNQRVFGCYRLIVQRKKDANRYSLEVISPSNFIEGGGSDDLLF